jgi:hypothetical protein
VQNAAYHSRLILPCTLANSRQRLETGGFLRNLRSVRDNDGFAVECNFSIACGTPIQYIGLHRFLFFFLSFSLSFLMLMSLCFHFPLYFPIFRCLFTYLFISLYLWFSATIFIIVYLAKYWGDQTKEDEMSRTFSSHGREGKGNRLLVGKVRRKRLLGGIGGP